MADPQVWQINVGGKAIKVEELPLKIIDRIAKDTDTSWFVVVNTPLADLAVGLDLIEAAAKHLKVKAPANVTVRDVVDIFELVPDTVPKTAKAGSDPLDPGGDQSETPGSPQ